MHYPAKYVIRIIALYFWVIISVPLFAQYFPDRAIPGLFKAVQTSSVFEDSKTFADAIPLYPLNQIEKDYQKKKNEPGFNLEKFIDKYYSYRHAKKMDSMQISFLPITEHIDKLWSELERPPIAAPQGSLLQLPNPYIVPGGRFNEIYYWDSYFTMLGLSIAGKHEMINHMIDNFAFQLDTYGFIPNGNRSYYLTRSQPPYFSLMVNLAASRDSQLYKKYLAHLIKEYNFWMDGAVSVNKKNRALKRVVMLDDGSILNRFWDNSNTPRPESYREDWLLGNKKDTSALYREIKAACESGWDFSSRWFKDGLDLKSIRTTEIIPVDLNCLLYNLEQTIAISYRVNKDLQGEKKFLQKAIARKKAILKYCTDPNTNFYMDYDFTAKKTTGIYSLAGIYPLYFRVADTASTKIVAEIIEKFFLYPGGVVTTTNLTHQQWDAPNGWAPLQYLTCEALNNYGFFSLSDTIANRWTSTVEAFYNRNGKLLEKYNVIYTGIEGGGGEYPTQDGFGWTNGVYLHLKNYRK